MNALKSVVLGVVGAGLSLSSWAGDLVLPPTAIPEPESLALVALAGVVGYLVKRRKK